MLIEPPDASIVMQTLTYLHEQFDNAYERAIKTHDRYLLCIACAHGNAFAIYSHYVDTDRVYDFMASRH